MKIRVDFYQDSSKCGTPKGSEDVTDVFYYIYKDAEEPLNINNDYHHSVSFELQIKDMTPDAKEKFLKIAGKKASHIEKKSCILGKDDLISIAEELRKELKVEPLAVKSNLQSTTAVIKPFVAFSENKKNNVTNNSTVTSKTTLSK